MLLTYAFLCGILDIEAVRTTSKHNFPGRFAPDLRPDKSKFRRGKERFLVIFVLYSRKKLLHELVSLYGFAVTTHAGCVDLSLHAYILQYPPKKVTTHAGCVDLSKKVKLDLIAEVTTHAGCVDLSQPLTLRGQDGQSQPTRVVWI